MRDLSDRVAYPLGCGGSSVISNHEAPVTWGAGAPLLPRRLELRVEEIGRNGDFVAATYSVVRD